MFLDQFLQSPERHLEVTAASAVISDCYSQAVRFAHGNVVVCQRTRIPLPLDVAAFDTQKLFEDVLGNELHMISLSSSGSNSHGVAAPN